MKTMYKHVVVTPRCGANGGMKRVSSDAKKEEKGRNYKSVQNKIPPYFQYKESPCISYSYTQSLASKIFNYKASLQQLDFQSLSHDPQPCNCSDSKFLYAPCGHIVTGDVI